VWVANVEDNSVARIDPATARVTRTVAVGSDPSALAVSGGTLWVASDGDNELSRVAT
jgi:YVTN family beta-propeller protein